MVHELITVQMKDEDTEKQLTKVKRLKSREKKLQTRCTISEFGSYSL
jgi:hypothetical protein